MAQSANWLKSPNGLLRAKKGHTQNYLIVLNQVSFDQSGRKAVLEHGKILIPDIA